MGAEMAACESILVPLYANPKLIAKQTLLTPRNNQSQAYHWGSKRVALLFKRLQVNPQCQALSVVREHYFAGSFSRGTYCACAKRWVTEALSSARQEATGAATQRHRWGNKSEHLLLEQMNSTFKRCQAFTTDLTKNVAAKQHVGIRIN